MFKAWSVVNDDELKLMRDLVKQVSELERGCSCDYDYRCRPCSALLHAKWLAGQVADVK